MADIANTGSGLARTAPPADGGFETWKPLIAIVVSVAGSAAWVSLVGALVLGARLHAVQAVITPTLSIAPTEATVLLGLRFLAVPIVVAALGVALMLLIEQKPDAKHPRHQNGHDQTPRAAIAVLVVAFIAGISVAAASTLSDVAQVGLVVGSALVLALIGWGVRYVDGFTRGSTLLFGGLVIAAGVFAWVYEVARPPRLDIAAVFRPDKSVTTGFLVTQSGDTVIMLVAVPSVPNKPARGSSTSSATSQRSKHNGKGKKSTKMPAAQSRAQPRVTPRVTLARDMPRCQHAAQLGAKRTATGPQPCYFNEVLVVSKSDVAETVLGPRGVHIDPKGYNVARQLGLVVASALP